MNQLLILCPLVMLGGFVDAVSGGGGIISLPAYLMVGVPVHQAYGCNKIACTVGAASSVAVFGKNGSLVIKDALIAAAASFCGALISANIVLMLSEETLKIMLLIVLPIVAVASMVKIKEPEKKTEETGGRTTKLALLGVAHGLYDGMIGPGSGTLAILLFLWVMKSEMRIAAGNAKVMVFASEIASTITYIMAGQVAYMIAIPATICGMIGSYIGSCAVVLKGAKFVRPVMMIVAAALLVKTAVGMI